MKFFKPLPLKHFFAIAAIVIALDQFTKWIVLRALEPDEAVQVIPRCFHFISRTNTGAAFSFFDEHPMALAIFASIVSTALTVWSWRLRPEERELRWPLGLILGGAIGNLIDRFNHGHVIDFIDWHWDDVYHFPTFNVADSAICVGMGVLILFSYLAAREEAAAAAQS